MHSGFMHLLMNMSGQLYLGSQLELVYGWWRVASVYLLGAIGGSLTMSVFDAFGDGAPKSALGASGVVYALFGALFANLLVVSSSFW